MEQARTKSGPVFFALLVPCEPCPYLMTGASQVHLVVQVHVGSQPVLLPSHSSEGWLTLPSPHLGFGGTHWQLLLHFEPATGQTAALPSHCSEPWLTLPSPHLGQTPQSGAQTSQASP